MSENQGTAAEMKRDGEPEQNAAVEISTDPILEPLTEAAELGDAGFAMATREGVAAAVRQAAARSAEALRKMQHADGYWVGDLTADSTLQSDYVLLQMWLYPPAADGSWNPPTMPKI